MSTEAPPIQSSIFNQSYFDGTADGTAINETYLAANYLKFPTAQNATETIPILVTTTDATINTLSVGIGNDSNTNVRLGYQSLSSIGNNGGDPYFSLYNVAIGYQSLKSLTTGYNNIGVGDGALYKTTYGLSNVAFGSQAGYNITGGQNTAIGTGALFGNSLSSTNTGSNNTAVGSGALGNNQDGNDLVAVGYQALSSNVSSDRSVAIGSAALKSATGGDNIGVGYQAGFAGTAITTGTKNTFIGYQAKSNGAAYSNSTALGVGATITASNQVVLGTTTETVRYNKVSPLYTSLPSYTSAEIGYRVLTSSTNASVGTTVEDMVVFTNVPIGFYLITGNLNTTTASVNLLLTVRILYGSAVRAVMKENIQSTVPSRNISFAHTINVTAVSDITIDAETSTGTCGFSTASDECDVILTRLA